MFYFNSTKALYRIIPILFLLLIMPNPAKAQENQSLSAKLSSKGFENVRVLSGEEEVLVSLENTVYRWDALGISTALDTIASTLDDKRQIRLVLLEKNQPAIVFAVKAGVWLAFRQKKIGKEEFAKHFSVTRNTGDAWKELKKQKAANSSTHKLDLIVYPDFEYSTPWLDQIYNVRFGLAPALEHTFWRGNRVRGQVIFPVYNDLDHEGDYIRPGYLTISQDLVLPGNWRTTLSAGNFSNHRYGFDLYANRNFKNENWLFELQAGYTGASYWINEEWSNSPVNTFTGSAALSWFWSEYNLQFKGGAAKYINDDYGLFASCKRYFRETGIEFYVQLGKDDLNGGFKLSIPLPLKKRSRIQNFLLLNIPENLYFTYNAGTESYLGQYYFSEPVKHKTKMRNFPQLMKTHIINL